MTTNRGRPPNEKGLPRAVNARTAPNASTQAHHTTDADQIQFQPAPIVEIQLCASGWKNPAELARVADAFALNESDFADRACGLLVGYLQLCAERGLTPDIPDAQTNLRERAAFVSDSELHAIVNTPIPAGDSIADLISDIQRCAFDRSEQLMRELVRDGLRTLHHAFNCPHCIRCARGERDRSTETTRKSVAVAAPRRKASNKARRAIYV